MTEVHGLQRWLLAWPELPELIKIAQPRRQARTPALEAIDFAPPQLPGAPTALGIVQLAQLLGSDARELAWLRQLHPQRAARLERYLLPA